MWSQRNLFGESLKVPKKLRGVCCDACYNAKEKKCVCKCHGAYHGLGNLNRVKVDEGDKLLPESEAERFRKQYGEGNATMCICGKADLRNEPIQYYVPHPDGWTISCEKEKAWLFVKCPKCGYDMSIWKMEVPRE